MEARKGRNPDTPGFGSRQPPPAVGQAQTPKMKGLLKAARRWDISATGYTQELTQAAAPDITPKRRNHVLGVDRIDHPKPTFLLHRLDVRRPNQTTIRKSLMWPWTKVTEHDAYSATRMDMNIHKVRSDQPFVVLGHSFRDAKEVKVRVALYVQVDCNGIDLRHDYSPPDAEGIALSEDLRRYSSFSLLSDSTLRSR
jgi:hypothetical protein